MANTDQKSAEFSSPGSKTPRAPRRRGLPTMKLKPLTHRSIVLGGGIFFLLFTSLGTWPVYGESFSHLSDGVSSYESSIQLQTELADGIQILGTTVGNSIWNNMVVKSHLYASWMETLEKQMRRQEKECMEANKRLLETLGMLSKEREKGEEGRQEANRKVGQIMREYVERERERQNTHEEYENIIRRLRILEKELRRFTERYPNRDPFEEMENLFT